MRTCFLLFRNIKWSLVIVFALINAQNFAQIVSSPIIQNYNTKDHGGSVSNFSIVQDDRGVMYFCNLSGVIKYDGNNWKLIKTANGKTAYDINAQNENKLFVSTKGELGYLEIDAFGREYYVTLTTELAIDDYSYSIYTIAKNTFFVGKTEIIKYSEEKGIEKIELPGESKGYSNFVFEHVLYIKLINGGLHSVEGDHLSSVENTSMIHDERIVGSVATDDGQLLLARSGNTYIFDGSLKEYPLYNNQLKSDIAISFPTSIAMFVNNNEQTIVIGTRKNGLYIINNGQLHFHVNQYNGLTNNEIRNVFFSGNVLWVSTQNGISKIEMLDNLMYWNPYQQDIGLIWDMIKYEGKLYVSTTKGMYVMVNNVLKKLGQSTERSYNLYVVNNKLYVNTKMGINLVGESEIHLKYEMETPNQTVVLNEEEFIVISDEGIFLMHLNRDSEKITTQSLSAITGMSFSGTMFKNDYWLSIINSGLYKLSINDSNYTLSKVSYKHGLPKAMGVEVFNFNNELVVSTSDGFYKLNPHPNSDSSNLFVRDPILSENNNELFYPIVDEKGNIWYSTKDGNLNEQVKKLALLKGKDNIQITAPLRIISNQEVTKIYPDPELDNIIWIASSEGLYKYRDNDNGVYENTFNTLIAKVVANDSLVFDGSYKSETDSIPKIVVEQPEFCVPIFTNNITDLSFSFSSTYYESTQFTEYSYFLDGYDKNWSPWNKALKKEYTNLNEGAYIFKVKSKNLNDKEGSIAVYKFSILPPWYKTIWAVLLFIVLGIAFVRFITLLYTSRLRKTKKKLEEIVTEKTSAVTQQKNEIEAQNYRLKEQHNEIELQHKNITEKNIVLESNQQEIQKINNELFELNTTKDKFFSIISHDLKGPLNSLTGFSRLLSSHAKTMSSEEIEALAKEFDLTLKNSYNLLVNLLEWSRSQSGGIEFKPEEVILTTIIQSNLQLLERQINDKKLMVSTNVDEQLKIFADKNVLDIVIRNLVSNAIKFSNPGGKVTVDAEKQADHVVVSITDNGVGIGAEIVEKLFKIEFKHSTLGTAKEKGTGLGLILCKEFIEKIGGKIWVESQEGKGSSFRFTVPSH